MTHQSNARPGLWFAEGAIAALLVATPLIGLSLQDGGRSSQSFDTLKPAAEVIYLLANSSVILGPDVSGKSEEITFTGTVVVPKYPLKGFERRKLADGKYQIDFELTSSELLGESYLLDGPILLGEHPDLPSLGTITQRTPGQDYPADFIVQRKVLIQTPAGTLHNEAPVPVRGTIDSIPPVRKLQTPTDLDVFRGEQLPIAMLDQKGEIGGWFYSKAHLAFAVDPSAVYRFDVAGSVGLNARGQQENVAVQGTIEVVRLGAGSGPATDEIVAVSLRGESRLLGGRIMLVEGFSEKERFSRGRIPDAGRTDSEFELFVEIKSPAGTLQVPKSIQMGGTVADVRKTAEITLSARTVNVYGAAVKFAGGANSQAVDELGRTVAEIRNIELTSAAPRRGPCCPRKPGER